MVTPPDDFDGFGGQNERDRDAERKRRRRAAARDVQIPACEDHDRRDACLADVERFLTTYFPHRYYQDFTPDRQAMIQGILDAIRLGLDQAIAAERGGGKTSIVVGVTLFCLFAGLVRFPVLLGKTTPDAKRLLQEIKEELEFNDRLAADFPEVCVPIRALEGSPSRGNAQTVGGQRTRLEWGNEKPEIVLPTLPDDYDCPAAGAILAARGMDASVRGLVKRGRRPDFALIDDPDSRESAWSEKQTADRGELVDNDIAGLGGPGQRFARVVLCTAINRQCLAYQYTDPDQHPDWNGKRYGFFRAWPDRRDLWDRYVKLLKDRDPRADRYGRAAHRFYLEHRDAMDAGAEVSNPDRYDRTVLADGEPAEVSAVQHAWNFIASKGMPAFLAEWQNDPPADEHENTAIGAHDVTRRCNGLEEFAAPDGFDLLTAMIDLGKQRLHWAAAASRDDAAAHVAAYGFELVDRRRGEGEEAGILAAADRIVRLLHDDAPFHNEVSGERVAPRLIGVDVGHWQDVGYELARRYPGLVVPVMGLPGRSFSVPKRTRDKRPGFQAWESRQGRGLWVLNQNTDYWRLRVHTGLGLEPGRPESLTLWGGHEDHLDDATDRYAEQLVADQFIPAGVRMPSQVYRRATTAVAQDHGLGGQFAQVARRNHYGDATSGALCLAGHLGVRPPGVGQSEQKKKAGRRRSLAEAMGQGRRNGRRQA
ncbi:MAG: terminase gpA endonuclease subunit [Planctomycetota bacterium]